MERLGEILPSSPYAFDTLLKVLQRFRYPSVNIVHDDSLWRIVESGRGLALMKISQVGTTDTPVLVVDQVGVSGVVESHEIIPNLSYILSADLDRASFFAMARTDDRLWSVIEPVYGLPELRTGTVFEALMQTIIEQQISWISAQRAQRWLVEWAGRTVAHDEMKFFSFPTPRQIAESSREELKPLKITHKRIDLMINTAHEVVTGSIDLEAIRRLSPEAGYERLIQIKGVGHWTAAVTLSRAVGHNIHIPDNDVALQAAVNFYFHGEEARSSRQVVYDTFEPYGEWAGRAASCTLSRWVLDRY